MKVRDLPHRIALLMATAVLFSVVVAEFTLRIAVPPWDFLDPRTDAFWAARLRSVSVSGLTASSRDVEFDPQLGWRMKRNFASQAAHHDARGFRVNGTAAKQRSGTRILMIGDSITYGFGVRDHETMAARLQQLTGAEVINMGVNGYGVDQAYVMWEMEGRPNPVSVVVLGYFVDDFYRNLLSIREAPKPHLVRDGSSYRLSGIPVQTIETWLATANIRPSARVMDIADSLARKVRSKLGLHDAIHIEAATRSQYLLFALRDSVAASGARLVVMVIPHCWREDPDAMWAAASIREASLGGRIPLLDLSEVGQNHESFGANCHWNADGHRLAAEKLFAMLGAKGWLGDHESAMR